MQEHKKIEILDSISSENELREELIIPLFRKIGYEAIDNQGPNEYGTDVILKQKTKLGTDEYTSILLKKGDINNKSGDASSMIRLIYDQILQATKAPIDHPAIKNNIYPNIVWIATNGKISSNAKTIFHKLLKNQFETVVNIEYIDRVKLIELIDEHWSEFYIDRRPFLSQYADILREELTGINVSDIGDLDKSVDSILIPQMLNEKKDFGEESNKSPRINKPITPIKSVNIQSKVVFITGEAGAGKSTLLKRLAIDILEAEDKTPVVISARKLLGGIKNIDLLYEDVFSSCTTSPIADVRNELNTSNIVLLVDALDEIRSVDQRKKVMEDLASLVDDENNNISKIIISTRPESDSRILSFTRKYKSFQVMPVEAQQVSTFFLKWFGIKNKSKADALFSELKRKSILDKLPKTPMTLTLLAILYETKGDVPTTLTELYKMFSDLLLGKWDHKKGINSLKNSQVKSGILSNIAWTMHADGVNSISQDKLISIVSSYLVDKLGDRNTNSIDIVQDIIDRSCLLVPYEDGIKFKHFSFQEYFCSQEVYCKSIFRDNLVDWVDDSWWSDVLFFSAGSLKNIDDYYNLLHEANYNDKFTSRLAIGGMLQSAYETSVKNKRGLISCASHDITEILDDVIKTLLEMNNKLPYFISYALVIDMLSDNYSSSYLEMPLQAEFAELESMDREIILRNLFIAASMAKSGNISGLMELSTSPEINDPISLMISDMMLDEYESKFNNGKMTSIHKSIKKKINNNKSAVRQLLSPQKI